MENTPLVYILECNSEFFKIGLSRNSIDKRISQCQTGNPYKITLHSFYITNNPSALESYLHIMFKEKREMGEWFSLSIQDIEKIPDMVLDFRRKHPLA